MVILISGPIMTFLFDEDMTHVMEDIDEKLSQAQLLFMAVLFMPILEEVLFRAHLRAPFWKKVNFGFPFYFTAGLFAIIHLTNISMPPEKWYLGPLLVLPQLILGLLFGYVRVRNNIFTSIFCHILHNGLAMSALFMAPEMN